jgi:hypothetical protein
MLAKSPDSPPAPVSRPLRRTGERPESVLDEMRTLLRVGDVQAARELVAAAGVRWPEHIELQTAKRVLAKGSATPIPGKRGPDRDREFKWLKNPPERYRGQWVALLGSDVVGSAGSLQELLASIPSGLEHPPLTVKIAP